MGANQGGSVFAEKIRKREWGYEPGNGKRIDEAIPLQNSKFQVSSIELDDLSMKRHVTGAGKSADNADHAEDN